MTLNPKSVVRLKFLTGVVCKECQHLLSTHQRLFETPFTIDRARQLETDPDLSEWVEAFVGRFGRLQDTIGDKLLPMLLVWHWVSHLAPQSTTWTGQNDWVYWTPSTNG
jgi:hypothetical protein